MSSTSIYDQHTTAFRHVSAYVVLKDNELVARIAFKFPKDGAGRLYAYVHWLGTEMVRGYASGYGYDKRTAACADASKRIKGGDAPRKVQFGADRFVEALSKDEGTYWDDQLRKAGFMVIKAV